MNFLRHHFTSRRAFPIAISMAISVALLLTLLNGNESTLAEAQSGDTPTPVPSVEQGELDRELLTDAALVNSAPPQYSNIDSNLNRIIEQLETGQLTAQVAAEGAPVHREESVAVTLYVIEGYAKEVSDFLSSNGASPRNVGIDYIEAYVPVSLLESASQQDGVIRIETIIPSQPAQSQSTGEGVEAHGADVWHDADIRGNGVKIGVIDNFEDFSALMGTELPSSVHARCYTDIGVFTTNRADCEEYSNHGTAITEVLFDIAPKATYYISNPNTRGDLKTAVEWMVEQEVDVIQAGSSWFWEGPGDGSTPFSNGALRSVDTAVTGGGIWINAAGNQAKSTWFGSPDRSLFDFHRFDGTNFRNYVNLKGGKTFVVQLRWDDTWGGAATDLDMYLFREVPFGIVEGSYNEQSGNAADIPFEWFSYTPPSDGRYYITVSFDSDTLPDWLQLHARSQEILLYHTLHHSIGNPAESANSGMLGVGAAPWDNTNNIEDFSSRGPTPDDRIKPDLVGSDETYSVAFGERWRGTSQSAAHVSGLAALVKQRFPDYTPQQIASYLKNNAEARGTVPNNTWGHGFASLPASDAAMTNVDSLVARYDTNNNGQIEKNEVVKAINDYLFGVGDEQITKAQVIEIINRYLFG